VLLKPVTRVIRTDEPPENIKLYISLSLLYYTFCYLTLPSLPIKHLNGYSNLEINVDSQ